MTWLLTGGAGYIGAHVAHALRSAGFGVVALDDLSSGVPSRLPADVPLVQASVLDAEVVRAAVREHDVTGVIHLAAKKAVGESVEKPLWYYRENVTGFETLLRVLDEEGVSKVVFSSSAAVYGMPDVDLVTEDTPTEPINPYGETKLICEWMLRAQAAATGMRYISLRYFNVAGAGAPELGDTAVANLIPMVFRALDEGRAPQIFGDDYPTADGTCIRDYIHVADLADAHVAAARRLDEQGATGIYNVGRGVGSSVKEVMEKVRAITGIDVEAEAVPRRPGDPARLVASAERIANDLGWTAERDLDDMVATAWQGWATRK
ncbi:MAG: exoB [Thermoleophilia bacterium]|nr:exoB [Thermoleophilia bacterium]